MAFDGAALKDTRGLHFAAWTENERVREVSRLQTGVLDKS